MAPKIAPFALNIDGSVPFSPETCLCTQETPPPVPRKRRRKVFKRRWNQSFPPATSDARTIDRWMAGYMPVVYEIEDLLSYCFLLLFRTYGPTFSSLVVLGRRRECVMFVFMGGVRDILGQQCAVPRFGYQYFWKRRRGMSGRRAGACMERPPVPAAFSFLVTLFHFQERTARTLIMLEVVMKTSTHYSIL